MSWTVIEDLCTGGEFKTPEGEVFYVQAPVDVATAMFRCRQGLEAVAPDFDAYEIPVSPMHYHEYAFGHRISHCTVPRRELDTWAHRAGEHSDTLYA